MAKKTGERVASVVILLAAPAEEGGNLFRVSYYNPIMVDLEALNMTLPSWARVAPEHLFDNFDTLVASMASAASAGLSPDAVSGQSFWHREARVGLGIIHCRFATTQDFDLHADGVHKACVSALRAEGRRIPRLCRSMPVGSYGGIIAEAYRRSGFSADLSATGWAAELLSFRDALALDGVGATPKAAQRPRSSSL